jgi:Fe-S-cluster containining protein
MPALLDILHRALSTATLADEHVAPLEPFLDACDSLAAESIANRGVVLACAGCSHCCHQHVSVVPAEVFALVHHVRDHFTSEMVAALMERVNCHLAKLVTMTFDERSRQSIACPFLMAGRCSVYAARPVSCRAYHSTDRDYCARYEIDPGALLADDRPIDHRLEDLWLELITQSNDCYQSLGYEQQEIELVSAFARAMSDPVYEERWRAKAESVGL